MKRLFRNILTILLLLTLSCGEAALMAMPAPAAKETAAQQKKKAEAAKKKKEQEAAKAKKQKEQEKKKAAAARENAKKQAQREKDQAQRQKEQAKVQAQREKAEAQRRKEDEQRQAQITAAEAQRAQQEEAQKQAWLREQEELANPKTEVVSLFNISGKVGYAAMMDNMAANYANVNRPGQLGSTYPYQSLVGGPGAGIAATYELEYGHFRFETGLDFTWLNSTSHYEFMLQRQLLQPHEATYNYITDDLLETRNVGYIGIPVMFGAQFSRYWFMLGAKVGYGLFGNYRQKGQFDIVVDDKAFLEQYGLGTYDIPAQAADKYKLAFRQPSVSLCAEVGIDLDEWLQASPDKKNRQRVKAGERLPFGKEHIHYKVSAFAEYGILNTNGSDAAYPLVFSDNAILPDATNTVLAIGGGNTKLNNLFVGLKFAVQFEVPGKTPRPTPPPASYAEITVVDALTGETLPAPMLKINSIDRKRTVMQMRTVKNGQHRQKVNPGNYQAIAQLDGYYPATVDFSVLTPGDNLPLQIRLQRRPVFNVKVVNADNSQPMQIAVALQKRGTEQLCYTLHTDSVTGEADMVLADSLLYDLHIEQMGFETYHAQVPALDSRMTVVLQPVKKGDVFVVHNLFFATNKTRILKASEPALNELYQYLSQNTEINIRIIGHTDNVGSDAANQRLSEGRAAAVRADLIERGIAPERLQAEGRGESQPVDTNDTEEGRQNNRRVEIEIL
ncbi:MAG: OmpA family protein [Paludibacteraceae bacterium]